MAVALVTLTACSSTSAQGDPEQGSATTTSSTITSAATTSSSTSTSTTSTSTTSTSTTTTVPPTTTLPLPSVIVPDVLPDVVEGAALGPQPDGPNARNAAGDRPDVYDNGCHVAYDTVVPEQRGCFYGDTTSDTLIAVMGDSHAAAWVGAFDEAGKANGWKIVMVTKTGCPIADVTVYAAATEVKNDAYTQCDEWRPNALAYVNDLQPAMVVFPMLTRRTVVGLSRAASTAAWQRGLAAPIDVARSSGAKVLVVGDVPKTKGDSVPACIAAHRSDVGACANTRADAVKVDRLLPVAATAVEHGATYVDASNWFCTADVCPVVIGGIVVYRDDHHITDTFSRYRAPQIAGAIQAAFATR